MTVQIDVATFEFSLELAWLGAKCKGKTLLIIEILFALHRDSVTEDADLFEELEKLVSDVGKTVDGALFTADLLREKIPTRVVDVP